MREMRYLDKLVDELAKEQGHGGRSAAERPLTSNRTQPLFEKGLGPVFSGKAWPALTSPAGPSRARMRVASSAYSRWPPTGTP